MTRLTRQLLSLRQLLPGQGRADAPRVWLALWSHVRWKRKRGEVWVGDLALARETGLCVRRVQRALLLLERSGLLWRRIGKPYGARKVRRIIELQPKIKRDRQPKIYPPAPESAEFLHLDVRDLRERPSATISLFWAIYVAAQMTGGTEAFVTMAALQDMTASRSSAAFYARLEDLARAGLIEKVGEGWAEGIRVLRYTGIVDLPRIAPAKIAEPKMPASMVAFTGGRAVAAGLTERIRPPPRLLRAPAPPPPFEGWAGYEDPVVWEVVG